MDIQQSPPSAQLRCRLWLVVLVLVVLQALLLPGPADASSPPTIQQASLSPTPLLGEGISVRSILSRGESFLSDRRRMIQLATIGMCIGLYILMRKN